jgi:hypothetical protein
MPYEISGLVIPFNQLYLLVSGPDAAALGTPLFGPPVFLRPGYRLWEMPEYLLPHTVVDDIGQEFGVPEVYEWLETQGDLFPRSDVLGDLAGGGERGVVTKQLDLTDMAVFASPQPAAGPFVRLALALEARAVPDVYALTPSEPPVPLLARALPSYRLAPGVFGAVGAAILTQLLTSRRRDWRLTFDELDEMLGEA